MWRTRRVAASAVKYLRIAVHRRLEFHPPATMRGWFQTQPLPARNAGQSNATANENRPAESLLTLAEIYSMNIIR
jgi:hypothetical protein